MSVLGGAGGSRTRVFRSRCVFKLRYGPVKAPRGHQSGDARIGVAIGEAGILSCVVCP